MRSTFPMHQSPCPRHKPFPSSFKTHSVAQTSIMWKSPHAGETLQRGYETPSECSSVSERWPLVWPHPVPLLSELQAIYLNVGWGQVGSSSFLQILGDTKIERCSGLVANMLYMSSETVRRTKYIGANAFLHSFSEAVNRTFYAFIYSCFNSSNYFSIQCSSTFAKILSAFSCISISLHQRGDTSVV